MGRSTRRGSLDELRKACDALDAAQDADELATVLATCLIESFGFQRVLFLIPQTASQILCLAAIQRPEENPSSPLHFRAEPHEITPADRAWLDDASGGASPEIDLSLHPTSSLYQACLKHLSAPALLCFPLRSAQQVWGFLIVSRPVGSVRWGEHLLPVLLLLTRYAESVLRRCQPTEGKPNRTSALEYESNAIVGALAHELRNPLNSIKTAAQFLRAKYNDHAAIFKFLSVIIDEVEHLSRLTTTLLEWARPLQLERAPHDVNALVRQVTHFMGHVFPQHHIEVSTVLAPDLPPVSLDVKQMEQALRNAFLNAIEAMPHGGTLHVATCGVADGWVQIDITDSGMGIPQEEADKVFDSFYTTKPDGTGLGLPILHRIVRGHGGNVALESTPGVGTSLIISLPAAEDYEKSSSGEVRSDYVTA